jgi:hypothetical protein
MSDDPKAAKPEGALPVTRVLGPSTGSILTRVGSTVPTMVQKADAAPVIENSGLPLMPKTVAAGEIGLPDLLDRPKLLMEKEPKPLKDAAAAGARMAALPSIDVLTAPVKRPARQTDQLAPKDAVTAKGGGESYLRILVSVSGDGIEVTDIHEVDGALGPVEPLQGGLAYEVSVGDRALRTGAIPEPGVRRSFAGPKAPPELRVHNFIEVPDYEFTVRVPRRAVSSVTIPQMHIAVLRLDPSQVILPAGEVPLAKQAPHLAQEVIRLRGIDAQRLSEPARASLARVLG